MALEVKNLAYDTGSGAMAGNAGLYQVNADNSSFGFGNQGTTTMMQPTLIPSIAYSTQLALTVTCTVVFSLIFLFVYIQLWLVLYYKHKKRSYQTIFLFLCLVWAALRVTLFSFYFKKSTIILANNLNPILYWLLYSCPVVLQFTTLVLLVLFFSQVVVKAKYPLNFRTYRFRIRLISAVSLIVFSVVNVACGIIAQFYLSNPCKISFIVVVVRVGINGSLFLLFGIALSYWIFLLNKVANARALLESRGTNLCQSWTTCIFIVFIFASRALYNVFTLAINDNTFPDFGYGWINVTDQADLVDLTQGYNYAVYLGVLFFWEILPTMIVTVFFRVQRPSSIPEPIFDDVSYRQQYFFDNPRRYDSDEDLSIKYGSNSFTGSSHQENGRAINSNTGSGDNTPIRPLPSRYEPRLASSSSRAYTQPEYNGT